MLMTLAGIVWKILPKQARTMVTRSVQTRFTVSAAGVIFNDSDEALLLDHFLRPHSGWGVAGGFMNAGEQPEAAFRREIKEETGLDLRDVRLYRTRTVKRHIEIIFVARAVGEAGIKSGEIKEFGWFTDTNMPPEMSLDQQFLVKNALEWLRAKN